MEPGQCYLILTVDWYAFAFRFVKHVGPYEFEAELVSKFDTNNGDVFGEIAVGDERLRRAATYQHFQSVGGRNPILGLGRVATFPWAGKLPQEYSGTPRRGR